MPAMSSSMPPSSCSVYAWSCAYARSFGTWRRSSIVSAMLPRHHRGELELDHEERQPLNDNPDARADERHASRQLPCNHRHRRANGYVSHIQPDVCPHEPLESSGTPDVSKHGVV